MTASIAKTWTIGGCAFVLLAFTDAAQAQRPEVAGPGVVWPFPWSTTPQLPACSNVGQRVTLGLSTGVGGPPLGKLDPIWTVAGAPAYSTSPNTPFGYWFPSPSLMSWIQPAAGGTPKLFAQGTYVYQTQFVTPVHPYFYDSIRIMGYFGADDRAIVKLNGNPIAECNSPCFNNSPRPIAGARASNWRNFTQVTTGLGSSYYLNILTVEVTNTSSHQTPSGLFVQATVTALCSKCTSPMPPVPQGPSCVGNPLAC